MHEFGPNAILSKKNLAIFAKNSQLIILFHIKMSEKEKKSEKLFNKVSILFI